MIPMACSTLNPPKVISEMPSSLFLRHTASTWGTKRSALQSSPNPKITATICFIVYASIESHKSILSLGPFGVEFMPFSSHVRAAHPRKKHPIDHEQKSRSHCDLFHFFDRMQQIPAP